MKKIIFSFIRKMNSKKFGSVGLNSEIPLKINKINNPQNVYVGNYVKFGSDMVIYTTKNSKVVIKDGTIFGPRCKILTSNHNYDSNNLQSIPYDNINIVQDVVIEEACWIGDSVIILPGVHVGKGAVIGSGCVVSKNVPSYAVIGGNPMKIIKYRDSEIFEELLSKEKFALKETLISKEFLIKGK